VVTAVGLGVIAPRSLVPTDSGGLSTITTKDKEDMVQCEQGNGGSCLQTQVMIPLRALGLPSLRISWYSYERKRALPL
jgi:hypothetical protein